MKVPGTALLVFSATMVGAAGYQTGDQVEASPLGLASRWERCTVVAVDAGNNVTVACGPRRTEHVVGSRWIRPATTAKPSPPAATPHTSEAAAPADRAAANAAGCTIGARVVDRERRRGTIVGVANGMCTVKLDEGGSRSSLAWRLSPADGDGQSDAGGGLAPGVYTCSASGAGQFPVTFQAGGRYAARNGTGGRYTLNAATKVITFESGSLRGQYSELLGPGRFGLSSARTTMFATVCNRR